MPEEPPFEICDELKEYFREGDPTENENLELLLCADGKPDTPLIVWSETNMLVDGHRRYSFCKKHGLPFNVTYRSFEDMEAAKEYMRRRQHANRNLNDHEKAINIARSVSYREGHGKKVSEAVEEISASEGISARSVYRSLAYVKKYDTLTDDWKEYISEHPSYFSKKTVAALAKQTRAKQAKLLTMLLDGALVSEIKEHLFPPEAKPVPIIADTVSVTLDDISTKPRSPLPPDEERKRLIKIIEECERAGGALAKCCDKLFSEEGLGGETKRCDWKRQLDIAHRKIARTLMEVRERV
jgi:hypothetical protein